MILPIISFGERRLGHLRSHARESGHPVATVLRECAPQGGYWVGGFKPGDDKPVVAPYTEPSIQAEEQPCSTSNGYAITRKPSSKGWPIVASRRVRALC